MTTPAVRTIDPPSGDGAISGRARSLIGILAAALLVVGFFSLADLTRLDLARDEVAIATAVDVARSGVPADQIFNCFQGFCFEDDVGFARKWWDFSTTYLRLVGPGIVLALAVAAILDATVWRTGAGPGYGRWVTVGQSGRIARRRSALLPTDGVSESVAAVTVGALAAPVVAMVLVVFSPRVWGPALALAIGAALVARLALRGGAPVAPTAVPEGGTVGALTADVGRSFFSAGVVLVPSFVVAAFLGGIGTQVLTVEGVESVAGSNPVGVVLALVAGLAIDLPLAAGLPVAALALLIGADPVVVGIFLVALGLPGVAGWRDLAARVGARQVIAAVASIAVVAGTVFGGSQFVIAATGGPSIAWDGEACTYRGPDRFGPGVQEFAVTNDTEPADDGHTLAIVVGQLPDDVSLDHFAATVAADPTADLPNWFTVAGTREFVFPGTTETAEITLHAPGTYAVVCLDGGGFYVIFEFSMPQPMGWFDEFRNTFDGYVGEPTFQVAG